MKKMIFSIVFLTISQAFFASSGSTSNVSSRRVSPITPTNQFTTTFAKSYGGSPITSKRLSPVSTMISPVMISPVLETISTSREIDVPFSMSYKFGKGTKIGSQYFRGIEKENTSLPLRQLSDAIEAGKFEKFRSKHGLQKLDLIVDDADLRISEIQGSEIDRATLPLYVVLTGNDLETQTIQIN